MNSYLIILIVFGICFSNGYGLAEGESGSVLRRMLDEQNSESIKEPLQDLEAADDDSTDENTEWMKDLEDRITTSLVRLLEGEDELYKDARFDSIIKSLKATMLTDTGEVDEEYIRKFIGIIRKQDAAKRKQLDEITMNKLGFSKSDYQEFLDKFAREIKSGSPPASKAVKATATRE